MHVIDKKRLSVYAESKKDGRKSVAGERTIYQNWIVEIGHEPGLRPDQAANGQISAERSNSTSEADQQLEREVTAALGLLTAEEREFIIRFHFMGQGYKEIAELSGRAIYKLASIHKRAIKKLRTGLAGFVREKYGIKIKRIPDCPICNSGKRDKIEQVLSAKTEESTWRPIIRRLKDEFEIRISTPQQLIGHVRYHKYQPNRNYREAQ